jgi:hypothetical protein
LANFWAQIIWSSNLRPRACHGARQDFSNTKVAHLQCTIGQEEVARLQVSVQNVLIVNILQTKNCLCQPPQYLLLGYWLAASFGLLYPLGEVSTLTIIHQNAEPALLGEAFTVAHNVGMFQSG